MEIQQQHVSFLHNTKYSYAPLHRCVCVKRPHLEPIQEELEDECESESQPPTQCPVSEDDEEDEEDELNVLRPQRTSRSRSQSFPQVHLSRSQQEDAGQPSSSTWSISAPPKRSFQLSKISRRKRATPEASARRRATRRRRQKDPYVSSSHEPPEIHFD